MNAAEYPQPACLPAYLSWARSSDFYARSPDSGVLPFCPGVRFTYSSARIILGWCVSSGSTTRNATYTDSLTSYLPTFSTLILPVSKHPASISDDLCSGNGWDLASSHASHPVSCATFSGMYQMTVSTVVMATMLENRGLGCPVPVMALNYI